jgi:hypothetical protein
VLTLPGSVRPCLWPLSEANCLAGGEGGIGSAAPRGFAPILAD